VPEEIRLAAIPEGLISRARSATGRCQAAARTPENLRSIVAEIFANFQNGTWRLERQSTAQPATSNFSVEIIAAYEFRKGKAIAAGKDFTDSVADVAELWGTLTKEQQATVKALPRYQAAYAAEKSRRAAAKAERLMKKAAIDETSAAL
jgi:hypothetical protein